MRHGEFIINGVESRELKSLIQFRPAILTPQRKVQRNSISGVNEDYLFDEEAYSNTPINLELYAKGKSESEINYLKEKITYTFMGGDYIEFVPYWDEGHVYQVEVSVPPNYTQNGSYPLILPYTVELNAKPFKHAKDEIVLENSKQLTINNPTFYPTEPIITLYGTGDMNLIVNDEEYVFKSVDTDIIVDSQIESAYRLISSIPDSRDNRMYTMDFPLLKPGTNTLSVSGNATKFKVETRWRTLVS